MLKHYITPSSPSIKKQIKANAQKRGLSVSDIVENYLQNLIKLEKPS